MFTSSLRLSSKTVFLHFHQVWLAASLLYLIIRREVPRVYIHLNPRSCSVLTSVTLIPCVCLRVGRTVKTTRRVIAVNAALRDSTVWSAVSMTTVNPAPVPSPTQRTSKVSVFIIIALIVYHAVIPCDMFM